MYLALLNRLCNFLSAQAKKQAAARTFTTTSNYNWLQSLISSSYFFVVTITTCRPIPINNRIIPFFKKNTQFFIETNSRRVYELRSFLIKSTTTLLFFIILQNYYFNFLVLSARHEMKSTLPISIK